MNWIHGLIRWDHMLTDTERNDYTKVSMVQAQPTWES